MYISLFASAVDSLFGQFGLTEIILIIFAVLLAGKEILTVVDWYKNRGKNRFKAEEALEKQQEQMAEIIELQKSQKAEMKSMNDKIEMLITSDKNDIKAWIVDKYHEVMEKEAIDTYELDLLERRYQDYKQEGGNSYIEELVLEMRKLHKTKKK